MEEEKNEKTFTLKEVMNIVSKMQEDYNVKIQECRRTINDLNSTLNRLSFLLQIINSSNIHLFKEEFISKCVNEIEYILTPPEDNKETKTEE